MRHEKPITIPLDPASDIGVAAIEAELASRRRKLAFPPALERAFRESIAAERITQMIATSFVAIVLYDSFLVNDWLSLNDRFGMMLICRLGIFTATIFALIAIAYRSKSLAVAEWGTVAGCVLAVLLPMVELVYSHSTHKLTYQYGSVLVMMFATAIQRVHFRPAAVALTGMLSIQLAANSLSGAFDSEDLVAIAAFYGAAVPLQLMAAYSLERTDRLKFLLGCQGQALQAQLDVIARTDMLTGLYNRRHLLDFSRELWAQGAARSVAAILIDVDHFKLFNDSYGHLRGDDCLRALAACILETVAHGKGTAFRFGGEEMLVLCPGASLGEAQDVAHEIRTRIATAAISHPALGDGAVVTASFGLAVADPAMASTSDLIAAADGALYAAKRAGRDRIWTPGGGGDILDPPMPSALEISCA